MSAKYISLTCPTCDSIFERLLKDHKYALKQNPNHIAFCSKDCYIKAVYKKETVQCKNCELIFEKSLADIQKGSGNIFCSHKCSAEFNNKKRIEEGFTTKNKTKELNCNICNKLELTSLHISSKKFLCKDCINKRELLTKESRKNIAHNCLSCNKEFFGYKSTKYCKDCLVIIFQKNGCNNASNRKDIKRSKNEIALYELCKKQFIHTTSNDPIFNGWDADILIHDHLLAVHWNGPWHYIFCGHSLAQVQARDKIKHDQIEKSGWVNYIIRDDGKYNQSFVESEFIKLLEYIDKNYK